MRKKLNKKNEKRWERELTAALAKTVQDFLISHPEFVVDLEDRFISKSTLMTENDEIDASLAEIFDDIDLFSGLEDDGGEE